MRNRYLVRGSHSAHYTAATIVGLLRLVVVFLFFGGSGWFASAEEAQPVHRSWLAGMMEKAATVKPGMTVDELLKLFHRENGIARVITEEEWRGLKSTVDLQAYNARIGSLASVYSLNACSMIKINVKFEGRANYENGPASGSKIQWASKPYLEREMID